MIMRFNVTGMTCAACSARVEKVTAAIDGVEKVETLQDGIQWTKFELPFNKPSKSKDIAFKECFEGLSLLDSNAILFDLILTSSETIMYITSIIINKDEMVKSCFVAI